MEINSLEDAFVNLGAENLNFSSRNIPAHLSNGRILFWFCFLNLNLKSLEPKYLFWQQTLAIFLRKYYMTVRNWNTMLMFCFPIIFILIGCFIGKALVKQDVPVCSNF